MDNDYISAGRPLPRIAEALPGAGRTARITWKSGVSQWIDLGPALANHRAFVRLRSDDALFATMRVSEFGDCLEWSDGAELSAAWIEELSDASLDNAEFREAMEKLHLTLDGMAARLGIARRLVADYRKDKPIPKHIALATKYLLTRSAA